MKRFNLAEHPHRRFNPLSGEWILVSPHRAKRPWQGKTEEFLADNNPDYALNCYLCPTNTRANGIKNPDYKDTFVFVNDFSALLPDTPNGAKRKDKLFRAKSEKGICKVVCYSPKHNLTIPKMELEAVIKVVEVWQQEFQELGAIDFVNYVQIFENQGAAMGASNPHPHGQIWAQHTMPVKPAKSDFYQKEYFEKHGKSLLLDYVEKELERKERIVLQNDSFLVVVPYWAVWPFEVMIISKRHIVDILHFTDKEKIDFAKIYKQLTVTYDSLFGVSFPYSAGIHQKPTDDINRPWWHFHMIFYPPLLRSASIKKFMVGYEMLANPQRDITAEASAKMLRSIVSKNKTN